MKKEICYICKVAPVEYGCCAGCQPIARICSTSAEDGIKYGIPDASLTELLQARTYERHNCKRTTIIKAIDRAIRKLDQPVSTDGKSITRKATIIKPIAGKVSRWRIGEVVKVTSIISPSHVRRPSPARRHNFC